MVSRVRFRLGLHTECVVVDTRVTPIWNTMGVIPGHIKDEVVVVGNHRDGVPLCLVLSLIILTIS